MKGSVLFWFSSNSRRRSSTLKLTHALPPPRVSDKYRRVDNPIRDICYLYHHTHYEKFTICSNSNYTLIASEMEI